MSEFRIKAPDAVSARMLEEAFSLIARCPWSVVTYDVPIDDLAIPKGGRITLDDLVSGLLQLAKKQGMNVVADVLQSFGIERLGLLPADRYAEFARSIEIAFSMKRAGAEE